MRILSGSENRTTRNTAEPKPRRNTVFVFGISEKYLLNFFWIHTFLFESGYPEYSKYFVYIIIWIFHICFSIQIFFKSFEFAFLVIVSGFG